MKEATSVITSFTDKSKACCFTGHRGLTAEEKKTAAHHIERVVSLLLSSGVSNYIVGGALGFDTAAAVTLINLRETRFPHLKIIIAVPCCNQDASWKSADRFLYRTILEKADEVIYVSSNYHPSCMQMRNIFMVDNSSYCISYVNKNSGGAFFTESYAKRRGLRVINLAQSEPII